MLKWLFNNFINGNPITVGLVSMFVVGVFSFMIGWPAYLFLIINLLFLLFYYIIRPKKHTHNNHCYNIIELDKIEKKNRWAMGLLSFFVLFGNFMSILITFYSLKNDTNSSTTLGAMAVFQFIFIGIPYLFVNLVKRKSSFWYGLMSSQIIIGLILFLILYTLLEFKNDLIVCYTSLDYQFYKGNWLLVCPLVFLPVTFILDSIGKTYGFSFKDVTGSYGYDKEKNKYSIIVNKKLGAIGMIISFVWSILLLSYLYYLLKDTLDYSCFI